MKPPTASDSGIFTLRAAFGLVVCLAGLGLAMLSVAASNNSLHESKINAEAQANLPIPEAISPSVHDIGSMGNAQLDPASPGWSLVTAPKAAGPQQLQAITCVSDSDCWAIGYYINYYNHYSTLIEHWDGSSWTIVNSSDPAGTGGDHILYGVTCTSTSQCWAVGYMTSGSSVVTLVEQWNGTSWAVVSSPNQGTRNNTLYGVTCTTATNCWAVGAYFISTFVTQTLIQHWDGMSWSIVSSPNQNTRSNRLNSVSCTSDTDCWAVGAYSSTATQGSTLIERWNGTSWSIVSAPNGGTANNVLNGVTCTSASQCWAVGFFATAGSPVGTLIELWDGNSWAVVTSSNHDTESSYLRAVSCISSGQCWAVGYYFNGAVAQQTLIERWDGMSWTLVNSPNKGIAKDNLLGVACTSAPQCMAVGLSARTDFPRNDPSSPDQTLIERWNGLSWSLISSPDKPTSPGYLYSVACNSSSQCWAVGRFFIFNQGSSPYYSLIEQWNGSSWEVVSSRNPGSNGAALNSVACASAADCWAVGYSYTGSNQTLIEHWDGNSWLPINSPNQGTQSSVLRGVTCTSESNCWAVGDYLIDPGVGSSFTQTLIEKWDGNSWTIVSSPNVGSNVNNQLYGVTCSSESECWAVGWSGSGTLIEKWDGNSWTIVSSPGSATLESVTCTSAMQCWAIGHTSISPTQTVIEKWDGITWTIVSSPSPSTSENDLYDVACSSASDCWAVGQYHDDSASIYKTLIERWNGASWTVFNSPNQVNSFNDFNWLYGVTCVANSQCWSVGFAESATNSTLDVTLIEEYSLTTPPLTGVASRMTHGALGNFDVNLPLTGLTGIECRNGGGNYNVVFTFVNDVTNCGSAGTPGGSVTSGPNPNQCTENLTGMPNAQYTNITLNNVLDSQNNTGNISVPMGVLIGDANASGAVNSADVAQTKSRIGQPIDGTNFHSDVNANGVINATDTTIIKSRIGSGLP